MTFTDSTIPAVETKAQLVIVTVAPDDSPRFQHGDWIANHRAAQAAGNLAYSLMQHAGDTAGECAEAYHVAYVDTMRALGTPAACSCQHCHPADQLAAKAV